MDKAQAIDNFWNSFGLEAYDEHTVPPTVTFPYITYSVATDSVGNIVPLYSSLWYRDSSWEEIQKKADEISKAIGYGGKIIKIDDGYMWLVRNTPFAQRETDPNDDSIRRIYLMTQAEFLTAD